MLSNVSKKLACLMFAGVMLGVAVAEAGNIPTNNVPLYTYATKKIYCYNSPGGAQKGYIDPGDDITITKVQSNGWVYGNYPTSKGRVSRWVKATDLLADRAANYTRYAPTATTYVYKNSSHKTTMGSVNKNEALTVVGGSGNSRQVIYKLSNGTGYKMGWLPSSNCWTANQLPKKQTVVATNAVNKKSVVDKLKYAIYHSYDAKLSCDFDSYSRKDWRHEGVDFARYHKAPVYAAVSGTVRYAGGDSLNTFSIYDSANNKTVVYLHMDSVVKGFYIGKYVSKGTLIGYQGSKGTGSSHVHIEVRDGNRQKANVSKDSKLLNSNPYAYWNKVL